MHVTYNYTSPDGEEGFPGELRSTCKYLLKDNNLHILMKAKSSKTTHVNLVNHAYWNLDKVKKNIFNHELFINADYYLENDKVVVVEFMNVNCGACQTYAPYIEDFYENYGPNGSNLATVIALDINTGSTDNQCLDYIEDYNVTYPLINGN